jgi:hypothetical protein
MIHSAGVRQPPALFLFGFSDAMTGNHMTALHQRISPTLPHS